MARLASNQCPIGSCGQPVAEVCTYRQHERNLATGEKVPTGDICKVRMCEAHLQRNAAGEPRCAWHLAVESREAA